MKGAENPLTRGTWSSPADSLATNEVPIGSQVLYFC